MADPAPTPGPTPPPPDIDADLAAIVIHLIGPVIDAVGARFKGVDAKIAAIAVRLDVIEANLAGTAAGTGSGTGTVDPPPPPPPPDPLSIDVSIPSGSRPTVGQPLLFSALITGGAPGPLASYAWDFGDGTTSAEASPIHTYAASGTVAVKVVVVDAAGATAWGMLRLTVADVTRPPPPPSAPGPAA